MTYWWEGNRAEKFWVEIRWVTGAGRNLSYHLENEIGQPDPWHALAETVKVNDVIYHWHAREHRFVGRSLVAGRPRMVDGWRRTPLKDFRPIRSVVDLNTIRSNDRAFRKLRDGLRLTFPGKKLFLPFQYRSDGLRFIPNYFAKLPKSTVDILFDETGLAEGIELPPPSDDPGSSDTHTDSRLGFLAPFKPKADTDYVAKTSGRAQRRGRNHETLVNDFAGWLERRGFEGVGRNAAVDLGIPRPPVAFEAKYVSAGWKGPIREAVGQLYEYRYFKVAHPRSALIFLASKEVPKEWVAYLEKDRQIGVVWRSGNGFGLSKLARKFLHV